MRCRTAWTTFFVAAGGAMAHAQQAEVTRYDVDQGLPQSMVNHVLQDRDGFIWLGTGDGLARFDGSRFVVYKHDPRDSSSLSNNSIWAIAEADADHLWIGTRTGLDRLDRRTGRSTHIATGDGINRAGCWRPVSIASGRSIFYSPLSRDLLILSEQGIIRRPTGFSDSYCIRAAGDSMLTLFLRPDTLVSLDLRNGARSARPLPVAPGEKVTGMIDLGGRWLLVSDRTAWVLESNGSRKELPESTRAWLERLPGEKYVERAPDGAFWIGATNNGVAVLNADLSIAHTYELLPADERPLRITTLYHDRQGNTWVGTDGKGVFKIAPQRIKFGRCMPGLDLPWEPVSWFVRGFAQWDADRVLVSLHQAGFALFDERTGTLSPLRIQGKEGTTTFMRSMNDERGLVWTKDERDVMALDPRSGRVLLSRPGAAGTIMVKDPQGRILLIGPNEMVHYQRQDEKLIPIASPRPALMDGLVNLPERFALDPLGQWWASGIVLPITVWNSTGPLSITGEPPPDEVRMMALEPFGDGMAWMTTNDGLYEWSLGDRRVVHHYTIHDGLPDQFVYGILPGTGGRWWISSNNGLSELEPSIPRFRNYSTSDGLQSREFNSSASFRSSSGRLYFGGVNGFNHFLPSEMPVDPDTARVRITGITSFGERVPMTGDHIELGYGRNELTLEAAVLEFTAPERNRYAYRLMGYASTWNELPASRPMRFENLPDESYRLLVRGINGDGLHGPVQELLHIVVPLPFWASAWFYGTAGAALFAVLGLALFSGYRRRMKRRLERAEAETAELRMRMRLAKDIHDDVGSGLARMAALARSPKRAADAEERFDKLGGISGELLENLRDVVWMNDPRNGRLDTLLIRIRDHARDLFDDSGTRVVCDLPEPLPTRAIGGLFRRNVFLIAKEALQNAHKYGRADSILVRWSSDAESFRFEVSDDGAGIISTEAQGSGHGSENMRQRAAEIGAVYERTSAANAGTTVRLHGPSSRLDE